MGACLARLSHLSLKKPGESVAPAPLEAPLPSRPLTRIIPGLHLGCDFLPGGPHTCSVASGCLVPGRSGGSPESPETCGQGSLCHHLTLASGHLAADFTLNS